MHTLRLRNIETRTIHSFFKTQYTLNHVILSMMKRILAMRNLNQHRLKHRLRRGEESEEASSGVTADGKLQHLSGVR